jgi:hypothetical protein
MAKKKAAVKKTLKKKVMKKTKGGFNDGWFVDEVRGTVPKKTTTGR